MKPENNTVLWENGLSKDFKLFTIININNIKLND